MIHRCLYILGAVFALACAGCCIAFGSWLPLALLLPAVLALALGAFAQKRRGDAAVLALQQALDAQAALLQEQQARSEALLAEAAEHHTHYKNRIAHSLRMPISIIQGYTDILIGDLVEDELAKQEYLFKISERTTDLSHVLNEVLAENRGDADAVDLVRMPFDLLALLRDTVNDMAVTAEQRLIEIRLITAEEQVPFEGDEGALRRVLYNIIENSVKYMGRPGAINITLTAAGDEISVAVRDDGIGMDEGEVERIFNKGYQGTNSTLGSGTGLYLSRLIIRSHGGTVCARSSWGRGMGVYITLPRPAAPAPAQAQPKAAESALAGPVA